MLELGVSFISFCDVDRSSTAEVMGSGDMAVLATPAMVALMENAAMNAVKDVLDDGATTVGTEISVSHIKASAIGARVSAKAILISVEGRKLTFKLEASDAEGVIGEGMHTRFIVDRAKFLNKIKK